MKYFSYFSWKIGSDTTCKLSQFFLFFLKIGFDTCKLSPKENLHEVSDPIF